MQIDGSVNKGALNKLVSAIIFVLPSQGIGFMYKNCYKHTEIIYSSKYFLC